MCCRYAVKNDSKELIKRYKAIKANFNYSSDAAYPATYNPVVVDRNGAEIYLLKWGFLMSNKQLVINARSESIHYKPMFRDSFISRRCLVPANLFYEWKKEDRKKIKHEISFTDQKIFSFAGLYNSFTDKNGENYTGYVILTTEPNEEVQKIHNRMPVVLKPDEEDLWLSEKSETKVLQGLLHPYDNAKTIVQAV